MKADCVDHVIPHRGNRTLFWDQMNWQSLCAWHHDAIKPILERLFIAGKISAADLRMNSAQAQELTRAKYRPAVGLDGFAVG